ncbi:hypothetical protein [Agromyces humatus]|nr:hypothetical protein [Agromyces humatus]
MRTREFDVGEFTRTARGSLRDELDLTSFGAAPLAPEAVVVLGALGDLEGATMAHLRNVLVTPTHKDARVTAFLVTWAFEKFWIADALGAIVDANAGGSSASSGVADAPATRRGTRHARGPVRRALAGFVQGEPIVGAHTMAGLVDDWALQDVYERLSSDAADGGALTAVIETILAVKARHTAFFEEESRRRLAASPSAARLARRELRRSPWPLGAAAIDPVRLRALARFAWSGAAGAERLSSLERRIAELPGIGASAASAVRASLARDAAD